MFHLHAPQLNNKGDMMKTIKLKKMVQAGFTLIELMIAVAIVGILTAIAMPAYQNYTIKGQVSEGFLLAKPLQDYELEIYAETGQLPTTYNTKTPVGKYVKNENINPDGTIQITFGNDANQKLIVAGLLILSPVDDGNGNIHWNCTYGNGNPAWYPSGCTQSTTP